MAYASKYYNPVKAHEYYMKTRELKGYADRYGGSRGNGTSAASGGNTGKTETSTGSNTNTSSKKQMSSTEKHNQEIKNQIQALRDKLNGMDKANKAAYREYISDQIQKLREKIKGGSTSGFNQKGKEAAAYIKSQIEKERDDVIKKSNKAADKEMLGKIKSLSENIKAMRSSGHGFSHKQLKAKIKAMLGETKKAKAKAKKKHTTEYKQKYKDEIDKLRGDRSMHSYWDKKKPIAQVYKLN